MTKAKKQPEEIIEPEGEGDIEGAELTNKEHNTKVFAAIKEAEDFIVEMKATLKPVEPVKMATLAECNAMARNTGKKAKGE